MGPLFGGFSVLVFLLLGALGLPVFTGKAGIQVLFAGPTSGFLWGYFFAAVLGGTIIAVFGADKKSGAAPWFVLAAAALAATVLLFVLGISIGMRIINVGFQKALAIFLIPFIPGNVIKLILMVVLAKKLGPAILAYTE